MTSSHLYISIPLQLCPTQVCNLVGSNLNIPTPFDQLRWAYLYMSRSHLGLDFDVGMDIKFRVWISQ